MLAININSNYNFSAKNFIIKNHSIGFIGTFIIIFSIKIKIFENNQDTFLYIYNNSLINFSMFKLENNIVQCMLFYLFKSIFKQKGQELISISYNYNFFIGEIEMTENFLPFYGLSYK